MLAHPAEILSLIAVDEVAGLPWGPSVADSTTFADAIGVLKTYGLWENVPDSVRNYFEKADPAEETPKNGDFARAGVRNSNVIFAHNGLLCESALRRAAELQFPAAIVSTCIEGEAEQVATVLACMAREMEKNARPLPPPCVLIAGGETTVTIAGEPGRGGRNQELALAAALKIARSENIVVASIGTDGTDGPTDVAGAIVDGYTLDEAKSAGIDSFQELKRHNSSHVLTNLNDAIYTYDTKTNLMDLIILFVDSPEAADRTSVRNID
jgi:glycerate-2-kinase